jgi:hypothetical protein
VFSCIHCWEVRRSGVRRDIRDLENISSHLLCTADMPIMATIFTAFEFDGGCSSARMNYYHNGLCCPLQ